MLCLCPAFAAKLPTIATELDRAVYAVTNMETLEIIGKLLYNAACAPAGQTLAFRLPAFSVPVPSSPVSYALVGSTNALAAYPTLALCRGEVPQD